MIIEVTGTGTGNKGAELLLCAIKKKLTGVSNVKLAVNPEFGSYESRGKYGLLQKIQCKSWTINEFALGLLSHSFLSSYGLIKESQISGIMDASGFAFSDQLPFRRIEQFSQCCKRWKSQKKTIVLLPQALGPFHKEEFKRTFQDIANSVDLIFARDSDSYQYATQAVAPETKNIFKAPDITIDIQPDLASTPRLNNGVVLLVPNVRMLDKTNQEQAKIYPSFLAKCADVCRAENLTPKILIHDSNEDDQLIHLVQKETQDTLDVVRESDPVKLKGIIKQANMVIGSRFHALAGALSSGTPAMAVGWSHKYQHLFEDFHCPEMIIKLHISPEKLKEKLRTLVNERHERSEQLRHRSVQLKAELDIMWKKVFHTFGISS